MRSLEAGVTWRGAFPVAAPETAESQGPAHLSRHGQPGDPAAGPAWPHGSDEQQPPHRADGGHTGPTKGPPSESSQPQFHAALWFLIKTFKDANPLYRILETNIEMLET